MMAKPSSDPYVGKRGERFYIFTYDPVSRRTKRVSLKTNIERIANELLALEPHLIELLIAEGEKAPALT